MSKMKFGLLAALAAFGLTAGTAFATSEDDFVAEEGILYGYNGSDTKVEIPATIQGGPVLGIDSGAFYCNEYIESVIIPEGVQCIRGGAFNGCCNLRHVEIPSTVTEIGTCAFSYSAVTKFVFPAGGVTEVSDSSA